MDEYLTKTTLWPKGRKGDTSQDIIKAIKRMAPHPKILAAHPAPHLLGVRKAI